MAFLFLRQIGLEYFDQLNFNECPTMCRCIYGLLHDRLVILVTHQVQFALQADKILTLKEVHLLKEMIIPMYLYNFIQ